VIRKSSVFLLTIVAIALAVNIVCQAQSKTLLTRHVREAVLNGDAQSVGRLPATQSMRLVLVLPHRNQAELDNFLKELYDPDSASYRKFLTVEEFTARFGPSQEDYDSVIRFAEANGFRVVGTSRNRMNLDVTGSVASIERAFHLTMGIYQHPTENRTFFAPDREPTPDTIQLWHIGGLDNYSTPKPMFVRRDPKTISPEDAGSDTMTGSGPEKSFLGSDMRAAYYVDGNSAATLTGAGQSLGLFEFIGTDLTDLDTYYANVGQTYSVPITLHSVDTQSVNCVFKDGCDDTDQTIDMTQALGMAPGLSSLVMYIGTGGLSGQTLDDAGILNAMATASPLNAQLSCSWLWKPSDNTTDDPYLEEFAAQGQNFFVAAGDDGKWTSGKFYWPADSDWVTAVGGTDLKTSGPGGAWASETGWSDTGGGIGPDDFSIPSWQVAAAAGCSKCSQTFRNGPDVSANANFTFYVCADQEACTANHYGGTSFAAPMWAALIALADQGRASQGLPTLGYINPGLYTIGSGSSYDLDFHDIISGGNSDGSTVGYDLSTGLGSPNGDNLIDALVGLGPSFSLSVAPINVTIIKAGTAACTINIIPSIGFNSVVGFSASKVPSGVTATFNPNPATTNSTLTFAAGATAATGTATVTIQGVSGSLTSATTLSLTVNAPPTVTVSPTSVALAKTVVDATSAKKPVTLTNIGTTTLTITSIAISGDDSGDFGQTTSSKPCGSTLAAGKSCIVEVTFTPTQVGARTGQLTITDNSLSSPQTVALSGTGTVQATLSPASLTFPAEKVGTSSPAKVLTLANKQSVALTSIAISTTGDFSVSTTTCATSLAAKDTCKISVVSKPTQTGTRTGELKVADSAVGSPQMSSLTGTGK